MRHLIRLGLCAMLSFAGCVGVAAGQENADFTIRLRGITVGTMQLSTRLNGGSYAVSALIEDAGLLGVFRSFQYRASSSGTLQGTSPIPKRYEEAADTGRRDSEAVMSYASGVPRVVTYLSSTPPGPDSPNAATQGGTLDPASALFAIFRNQPEGTACNKTIIMYDGMRRSRLVLQPPRRDGASLRCTGEYRRLQGFTAKELERHVAFPLEITFKPIGNGQIQARHIAITSSYGLATLDRR